MSNNCSPVIIVPGIMGSKLHQGQKVVWGDWMTMFRDLQILSLPGPPTDATEVLDSIVIIEPLQKSFYAGLIRYVRDHLRYNDRELFLFPYDWRQDCRKSAQRLQTYIQEHHPTLDNQNAKFTILAHSMGGLVARYCALKPHMHQYIERIVTFGTPHIGSLDALECLLNGVTLFPMGLRRKDTIATLQTFPSVYQLLPPNSRGIQDEQSNPVDIFQERDWLEDQYYPLLADAQKFHQELASRWSPVPIESIYGWGQSTLTRIVVPSQGPRKPKRWRRVEYQRYLVGDERVPEDNAKFDPTRSFPVYQKHGALYNDSNAQKHLRDILCHRMPTNPSPWWSSGFKLIMQPIDPLYEPNTTASTTIGLVDSLGHIIKNAQFQLKVASDTKPDTPRFITQRGGDASRLVEAQFSVPEDQGGYILQVSVVYPEGIEAESLTDYFGVKTREEPTDNGQ